jgi:AAA15 family ATPase/GTPase
MILKALKYTRFRGKPREWRIIGTDGPDSYAYFDNFNLLVGKNASGKSRTLAVIHTAADLLTGWKNVNEIVYPSEKYELIFEGEGKRYEYLLEYEDNKITDERLVFNGQEVLSRAKGVIYDLALGKEISIRENDINPVVNDTKGNGEFYFPDLVMWARMLQDLLFANQSEKNHMVKDYHNIEEGETLEENSILIYTFHKGTETFGQEFISEIIRFMDKIGYDITNIEIQKTRYGYGLCVEEEKLYKISQREMSQGMFRALSFFIQFTYARMNGYSICVLVDDMGEGLDFDRSKEMINIMIKKINESNIQFFMTTNDRYIMNKIPLRYWTVIDRQHNNSIFYSYTNSKDVFDDFKYTGLNNFDFFTTGFFSHGFESEEEDINEEAED